jgi:hypothetical protein
MNTPTRPELGNRIVDVLRGEHRVEDWGEFVVPVAQRFTSPTGRNNRQSGGRDAASVTQ